MAAAALLPLRGFDKDSRVICALTRDTRGRLTKYG